jgi:DNA-binding transcriptional LysR family regulator
MSFKNLDLDTLRTLMVANDLGGYGQAADRLGRTPSAISLQMKRLQEDIGSPLFKKHGRGLALTEAGELTLRFGRRMLALNDELLDTIQGAALTDHVRLGCSQDFADRILPTVLARFVHLYPCVRLEVRIEGNAALTEAVASGEIDIALAVGQDERPTAQVLGHLDLGWIAGRDFTLTRDQPVPLILLGPQCAFRKEAIRRLDAAGIAWRIAATSPSLAGLWASAIGGLGLTLRSRLALPDTLTWHKRLFELPDVSSFPVTLHAQPHATSPSLDRLRTIIGDVVTESLPTVTRKEQGLQRRRARRTSSATVEG